MKPQFFLALLHLSLNSGSLFGRLHQGAIRGFVATTTVIGTAIGPMVFGLAFDHLGSYNPSLWLGIVLALIATVLALVVKKPAKPIAS